jgi:hypothetical protein
MHSPYVETVPAVPTGCFCRKIKFPHLTLRRPIRDSLASGRFAARSSKTPTRRFRRGRFAARSSKRSHLGRRRGRRLLTSGPEARRRLADHVTAVHRLKAARSVIHRFRLKRHLLGRRPHTA